MLVYFCIALIMFLSGMAVHSYYIYRTFDSRAVGKLKIDTSDTDGPYMFLELNEDVRNIQSRQYVIFKVDNSNYISQD